MVHRGEVWWVDLPDPVGSEPGYRRPVLILQINQFNVTALATTIGAVLTSNIELEDAPGNVLITPDDCEGLRETSVVNVSQIVTLDKSRHLDKSMGTLSKEKMREVEAGLMLILGLQKR